jgi:hypothetical protein
VNTRKYRLCINELEALVLKRMFELTKMNMSGTGVLQSVTHLNPYETTPKARKQTRRGVRKA